MALGFDKAHTPEQRVTKFWMSVEVGDPDDCWWWRGYEEDMYGRFYWNGRMRFAHDLALEFWTGEARPAELDTCHSCNNSLCVNPHHLRYDTRASNVADMVAAGRAGKRHLTADKARQIRERAAAGATGRQLADDYGVSPAAISSIVRGRLWKSAGGPIRNDWKVAS